jgi:tRNA(Arg) A34 adenosine deaminase TadA
MMTTAGNGPGPSGFVIVAGTPSALGAGVVAVVDGGAPLAHAVIVAATTSVATRRAQAAAGEGTAVARE